MDKGHSTTLSRRISQLDFGSVDSEFASESAKLVSTKPAKYQKRAGKCLNRTNQSPLLLVFTDDVLSCEDEVNLGGGRSWPTILLHNRAALLQLDRNHDSAQYAPLADFASANHTGKPGVE